VIVHPLEKLGSNEIPGSRCNHRVDSASSAHRSLILINPLCDLCRGVDSETVKAAAMRAKGELFPIVAAMAVCAKMILIETGDREAGLDHEITLVDGGVVPELPATLP
jgi:hypothetical protein